MDESRFESGAVGAAVVFQSEGRWVRRGTYLGKNKEVFDAEVIGVLRTVRLLEERKEEGQAYTVFSDLQAAVTQAQHD